MLLNVTLLIIVIIAIILLLKQLNKSEIKELQHIPLCHFIITQPQFEIINSKRIARYSVYSKNSKDRYFRDFPVSFKFYSDNKFKALVKIIYTIPGDDQKQIIYNKCIEFEDTIQTHIYYINEIIVGLINIEILTDSEYGNPTIEFELLQGNMCHLDEEHKIIINFPE